MLLIGYAPLGPAATLGQAYRLRHVAGGREGSPRGRAGSEASQLFY
jgi:hypothetical protein